MEYTQTDDDKATTFHIVASHHLDEPGTSYYEHMYIDICDGDLVAGILLAKIIYYFSPNCKWGRLRTEERLNGSLCIIRRANDWWEECRISQRRYIRAIKLLEKKGFIKTSVHFNPKGKKVYEHSTFIFPIKEAILKALGALNERKRSFSHMNADISPKTILDKLKNCTKSAVTEVIT